MKHTEALAKKLYELYCVEVGGIAFNGDPLPMWKEFAEDRNKIKQANAWRMVARYILNNAEITDLQACKLAGIVR